MLGRLTVFALGLVVGVAAHSSYSCVRARAGEALEVADRATPMDVPDAIASAPVASPAAAPAEALPSAAEGDAPKAGPPTVAPAPVPTGLADLDALRARHLELPVQGIERRTLRDTFAEGRTGHVHEAIDILAPRGTPVVAVEDGVVEKLFTSKQGGLTIYQFDPTRTWCYYYAHLDRYAPGLAEKDTVTRGQVIGYVGTSGNAPPQTPHLHFTIFKLGAEKHWWQGAPINPFPLWAAR
jgi:murein DD-endopeptidase MepM/ murein hydrolase activator NlpD